MRLMPLLPPLPPDDLPPGFDESDLPCTSRASVGAKRRAPSVNLGGPVKLDLRHAENGGVDLSGGLVEIEPRKAGRRALRP